ncbi:MAG: DnaJ domain-containing protein [Pseudomonadota bacterium]
MNHYDVLEVSPHASPAVVRAAFKSLMQRWHPDKHPDDSALAARAAQIVQAYEVLSDADRRAAYDAQLKRLPEAAPARPAGLASAQPGARPYAAYNGPAAAPSNWYFWLLGVVILVAGGSVFFLPGARPFWKPEALVAPVPPLQTAARPPAAQADNTTTPPAPPAAPRQLALLSSSLDVELTDSRNSPEDTEGPPHFLSIAALTVDIGPIDSAAFTDTLERQKATLLQRLSDRLAGIPYAELRLADDRYLVNFIHDALRDITGTKGLANPATGSPDAVPAPRYGIIAVSLPASFALR